MELDAELEQDLTFRRFSPEKQDQIRQLIAYTTLLGLTGKDLISIGGRLERLTRSREVRQNRTLAQEHYDRLDQVWQNSRNYGKKFIYTASSGIKYSIETDHWLGVNLTNYKTCKSEQMTMQSYETGAGLKGIKYLIAINIHHGNISFDF